jgi:parallel beta-helix repeat protein
MGVSVQGQSASAIIRNNIITGNRTGIDINNSNGNILETNVIDFNRTGLIFRNQTDNTVMTGNFITDNWTAGVLFLDGSNGSNSPQQSALNSNFNENFIVGNWYGDIVDRQSGGSLPVPGSNLKNFECNWYGVNLPVVSTANSSEPGYGALIPVLYGGSSTNPGGAPNILGAASANVDYVNWGLDANDDDAGTLGWQITPGTCTGSPVEIDMVSLSPNQFCQENGSIEVVFSGGSADYSIAWSGAESGVQTGIMASPYTISNLIHGAYSITITDANGSSANSAVFITNHPVRNTTLTQYYPTFRQLLTRLPMDILLMFAPERTLKQSMSIKQ